MLGLYWLAELSEELKERIDNDTQLYGRIPKQFSVSISVVQGSGGGGGSNSNSSSSATTVAPHKYDRADKIHLSKVCVLPSGSKENFASVASSLIKKAVSSSTKVETCVLLSIYILFFLIHVN
jgi:hypothetical protein